MSDDLQYEPQATADAAVDYLARALDKAQLASESAGVPWNQLDPTVGILALAKSVAQEHPELFQHPSPELLPSEQSRQVMEGLQRSEQRAYSRGLDRGAKNRTNHIIEWLQSDGVGMAAAAAAVAGKFGMKDSQ